MVLEPTKRDTGVDLLGLFGRLDIVGTGGNETRFTGFRALENGHVVIDLSGVDFLASIGILHTIMEITFGALDLGTRH